MTHAHAPQREPTTHVVADNVKLIRAALDSSRKHLAHTMRNPGFSEPQRKMIAELLTRVTKAFDGIGRRAESTGMDAPLVELTAIQEILADVRAWVLSLYARTRDVTIRKLMEEIARYVGLALQIVNTAKAELE